MAGGGHLILSGDCGGTNTRLTLSTIDSACGGASRVLVAKKFQNKNYLDFVSIVTEFLQHQQKPTVAVLACAGPIMNNSVSFTNVKNGWNISGDTLAQTLHIPTVKLINDFAAMGYGLLTLKDSEVMVLNDAEKDITAPIATIGAGTGLGECFLTPNATGTYECYPCEGGHTDFAPISDIEVELMEHLKKQFGCSRRLSVERVVSGPGLGTVYEFLSEKFPEKIDEKVHDEWQNAGTDKGAIVGKYAKSDALCHQALEIFVGAYGREAGNAALKYLPRGGFYITGGLAAKNVDYFTKSSIFMDALFDKGRVSRALKTIPIYLVLTEDIGERGAHHYAYQLLCANKASKKTEQKSCSSLATDCSSSYYGFAVAAVVGGVVGACCAKLT